MLLEPLARVALVDAAAFGELRGRRRASFCEGPVETEPVAQVDGGHLHGTDDLLEELARERVPLLVDLRFRGPLSIFHFVHRLASSALSLGAIEAVTPGEGIGRRTELSLGL